MVYPFKSKGLTKESHQDFSYYVEKKPGCFFFLGTKEEGKPSPMCHSADFDFNDALIPLGVTFWVRLVEDRLAVSLYSTAQQS